VANIHMPAPSRAVWLLRDLEEEEPDVNGLLRADHALEDASGEKAGIARAGTSAAGYNCQTQLI
jgi:hypothetical protein